MTGAEHDIAVVAGLLDGASEETLVAFARAQELKALRDRLASVEAERRDLETQMSGLIKKHNFEADTIRDCRAFNPVSATDTELFHQLSKIHAWQQLLRPQIEAYSHCEKRVYGELNRRIYS